ncbi:MAG: AAA family ATPase [Opitutales bacterium]
MNKITGVILGHKKLAESLKVHDIKIMNSEIDKYFESIYIFLVMADDKISEEEVSLASDVFEENITRQSLITIVNENYSNAVKILSGIPSFFKEFVKHDRENDTDFAAKSLFGIKSFTHEIIKCDSHETVEEKKEADLILYNLNKFLIEKGVNLELEKALSIEFDESIFAASKNDDTKSAIENLNSLIGLSGVKREVTSLLNLIKVRDLRMQRGIKTPPLSLHLVFTGNPGTGKTTVARIFGKILKNLNVLSSGHLVETDRSGLVAGYIGQTALKAKEVIEKAMGGILFVDEAYTLSPGGMENDYGQEAIDTILKAMEDHRDDFIVVVAGYTNEMSQFINSNPGLSSRFNKYIDFPDYDVKELCEIMELFCNSNGYKYGDGFNDSVSAVMQSVHDSKSKDFGNGRTVRNIFEKLIQSQSNRVVEIESPSDSDLTEFLPIDLSNIQIVNVRKNKI